MDLRNHKNILIKSYGHESGLLYLSLSLYKHLSDLGLNVKFIPKSKYIKKNSRYISSYLPISSEYRHLFYPFVSGVNVDNQIVDAINDHKATLVVSFETLMQNLSWVSKVRKAGVKVIDVPMLEWVSPIYFKKMSYKLFDEIWAVTDYSMETFEAQGYRNVKRVGWDFVDRELFFEEAVPSEEGIYHFYHQGSLNPYHSSKNTNLVLRAFERLNLDYGYAIKLTLTGKIEDENQQKIIKKHTNIHKYNEVLSRENIGNLYRKVNCVVVPSLKEGLGLSLFEASACGCQLITTDAPPMNSHNTTYLCKVSSFKQDGSLVPIAQLTVDSVYKQMKKSYEDHALCQTK